MTKMGTALALALIAPAAFGQTGAAKVVTAKPAKSAKAPKLSDQDAATVKMLRQEIKRDHDDLGAKTKKIRSTEKQLQVQEKAELAKLHDATGTRAEKSAARKAVRAKYQTMRRDEGRKAAFERKNLREDIVLKKNQIKKLRQS